MRDARHPHYRPSSATAPCASPSQDRHHPAAHLPEPVRAAPQADPTHAARLSLIQRRPDRQHGARPRDRRPHEMPHGPLVDQRLCRLFLRDARLGLCVERERVGLCEQLVVDGLEDEEREGDDGREEEGRGGVELEGERGGVLWLQRWLG
jgi:hypothetical protein